VVPIKLQSATKARLPQGFIVLFIFTYILVLFLVSKVAQLDERLSVLEYREQQKIHQTK
jgi:hypothetical protein